MTKLEKSAVMQAAYVFYSCVAIGTMIDSPFYSADARVLGSLLFNLLLIVWSFYMFITGFIVIANDANNKSGSQPRERMRGALRMIIAMFFGIIAQWFFIQAFFEGMN